MARWRITDESRLATINRRKNVLIDSKIKTSQRNCVASKMFHSTFGDKPECQGLVVEQPIVAQLSETIRTILSLAGHRETMVVLAVKRQETILCGTVRVRCCSWDWICWTKVRSSNFGCNICRPTDWRLAQCPADPAPPSFWMESIGRAKSPTQPNACSCRAKREKASNADFDGDIRSVLDVRTRRHVVHWAAENMYLEKRAPFEGRWWRSEANGRRTAPKRGKKRTRKVRQTGGQTDDCGDRLQMWIRHWNLCD